MTVKEKLSNLIDAANEATGESDTTLTDAVGSLIEGYGGSGLQWEEVIIASDCDNALDCLNAVLAGKTGKVTAFCRRKSPHISGKSRQLKYMVAYNVTVPASLYNTIHGAVARDDDKNATTWAVASSVYSINAVVGMVMEVNYDGIF